MAAPAPKKSATKDSAFAALGLKATLEELKAEVRELYLADDVPWIIGYSGGKDSTAVLQLTWLALAEMPLEQRRKTVHVISTDTLVENPVVASWVTYSLGVMKRNAEEQKMPIEPHRLTPVTEDSYWVNLIGKGYPAPRQKFRWCTERLKIRPSTAFITTVVKQSGEAILLLGSRKAESQRRQSVLDKHTQRALSKGRYGAKERLTPNASLPNTLVYTPIENWSNDDVWMFLMQVKNPWGYNNKDLLTMYQGASPDGECPLVVDSSTPSCGDSRFGCWVCTLVDKDKSMTAMIQNDLEKEWMMPLLEIRNIFDFREDGLETDSVTGRKLESHNKRDALRGPLAQDLVVFLEETSGKPIETLIREPGWERYLRDFRRLRTGDVQLMANGNIIPGPYLQKTRELFLAALLRAQTHMQQNAPPEIRGVELISLGELQEIRRIWVVEKHELEDSLPRIYAEATGKPYPGQRLDDNLVLGESEMQVLREICGNDRLNYELTRELLSVERQQRAHARRAGLFEQLEKSIRRHYYSDAADATDMARRHAEARAAAGKGERADAFADDLDSETQPNLFP